MCPCFRDTLNVAFIMSDYLFWEHRQSLEISSIKQAFLKKCPSSGSNAVLKSGNLSFRWWVKQNLPGTSKLPGPVLMAVVKKERAECEAWRVFHVSGHLRAALIKGRTPRMSQRFAEDLDTPSAHSRCPVNEWMNGSCCSVSDLPWKQSSLYLTWELNWYK